MRSTPALTDSRTQTQPAITWKPAGAARHGSSVTRATLPVSGLHAVLTERGARHTLEILDSEGCLLSVISDSLLDAAVLRGSWRGVRDGQPWALAVGRSISRPVAVAFSGRRPLRRGLGARSPEITPAWVDEFWLAEAAVTATRVSVTLAGVPAGSAAPHQLF